MTVAPRIALACVLVALILAIGFFLSGTTPVFSFEDGTTIGMPFHLWFLLFGVMVIALLSLLVLSANPANYRRPDEHHPVQDD
jgi:peptidoglycan/LPS O-acetylase OafA/YrhL